MKKELFRKDLIYPELSYEIVGVLFEVYNEIGPGFPERHYQKAIAMEFQKKNINFKEQVYTQLMFKGKKIGNYFLDFLVDNKVVLEIKRGDRFSKYNVEQVMNYLKSQQLKLGIIANFGKNQLKHRRIINFDS